MYKVRIADPFLRRQLLASQKGHPSTEDPFIFSFSSEDEFIDETLIYMMTFALNYSFEQLVLEDLCEKHERSALYSRLPQEKIEPLMDEFYLKIKANLDFQYPDIQFDFISFFLSEVHEERKKMKNIFYETLHTLYATPSRIGPDLLPESTEELLYFVVHPNGSIQLKDKFSDEIERFPYSQQEEAVVKTCHLNPKSLIIYDHLQLLEPEMVICLKQLLGRKVNFIDSPFPEY